MEADLSEQQREGLLGVTIRFLAGEQAVTDQLVPMIAASHALGRFDWVTYLSTFLMEEAKHAEFFMRWHDEVVGVLEPEEVAQALPRPRRPRPTPAGASRSAMSSTRRSPLIRRRAAARPRSTATEERIERAFVRFSAAYNGFVEGVLTMPSYEIVIDTTDALERLPWR